MVLTIGIDDAGRGPVIGPMIMAGVLLDENGMTALDGQGIKDSKLLSHSQRVALEDKIKSLSSGWKVVRAMPEDIDNALSDPGMNLNRLEAIKMATVINELNTGDEEITVIVDCPSINTESWGLMLMEYIEKPENLDVKCEHKADYNHMIVGAASILAKVVREEEVSKIKSEFGAIGSGYPADPNTKKFLAERGLELKDSGIFRKSWATWRNMFGEEESVVNTLNKDSKQSKLDV
jgi:ribonuclease HII